MRGGVSCAAAVLEIAEWAGRQRRCRGDGGRGQGEEACPARRRMRSGGVSRKRRPGGVAVAAVAMSGRGKLIAVLGDEDTVTGFLLGGVGELDKHRKPNFLVVEKETSLAEIEETFRSFVSREDIGIILISQSLAELIRHAVEAHTRPLPAVLEIPSKEHPYDPAKDSVLRRARGLFSPDELR